VPIAAHHEWAIEQFYLIKTGIDEAGPPVFDITRSLKPNRAVLSEA
jgi:hypothetical protein